MVGKKRLFLAAGTLASVGAVIALAVGVTFGLFSATETSGSNSFAAGTVSVGLGTPTSVTCSITDMVPGDSSTGAPIGSNGDGACTYNVQYTGSVPADLAVDVAVSNGGTSLYDGTNQGIQFFLSDGTNSYLTSTATNGYTAGGAGTTYNAEGGTSTSLPDTGVSNLLVASNTTSSTTIPFSLDYALPLSSGNGYQSGSVTVTLTFHAVQDGNQTIPGDCVVGDQCNASATFNWS